MQNPVFEAASEYCKIVHPSQSAMINDESTLSQSSAASCDNLLAIDPGKPQNELFK